MTLSVPDFALKTTAAALAIGIISTAAWAEGDLRVLQSERKHAQTEQLKGVTALAPAGAVIGIITGTEDDKLKALSGDYIKQIDAKMAQIKAQCNL